jgi:peptide/nickel transport system permease protein
VVARPYLAPSAAHWLGTNDIGQDIFSEILWGTRTSLLIGLIAATAAVLVGTGVGMVASLAGGALDQVLMRTTDVVLTIPFLPLAIVLAAFLGPSLWNTALVIALVIWARPARVVRSQGSRSAAAATSRRPTPSAAASATCSRATCCPGCSRSRCRSSSWRPPARSSPRRASPSSASATPSRSPGGRSSSTLRRAAPSSTAAGPGGSSPPGLLISATVLSFALIGRSLEGVLMPRLKAR